MPNEPRQPSPPNPLRKADWETRAFANRRKKNRMRNKQQKLSRKKNRA